jgi:hypothetical protein
MQNKPTQSHINQAHYIRLIIKVVNAYLRGLDEAGKHSSNIGSEALEGRADDSLIH